MAIIDDILRQAQNQPQTQLPLPAPEQPRTSWVSDLISNHQQAGTERLKRNPVGFEFKRDPFDPSSYYTQLKMLQGISSTATGTALQEAANRDAAARAAASKQDSSSVGAALGGIAADVFNGSSRKYGLKRVSSNTARAADYWGSKYGIKNIGGYASHGSVPGSDHPKGLALDFMINNVKNGSSRGTALANDVIKNYKAWNVKYVIWNRYIWSPSGGWHKYNGPSPHTDHVHVSFNK